MTPELLSAFTGGLLSIIFNVVPGLKDWYDSHSKAWQKLAMVIITGIAAVALTFWNCTHPTLASKGVGICLNGVDWTSIIMTWLSTYIPNQAVDRGTPKPGDSTSESTK